MITCKEENEKCILTINLLQTTFTLFLVIRTSTSLFVFLLLTPTPAGNLILNSTCIGVWAVVVCVYVCVRARRCVRVCVWRAGGMLEFVIIYICFIIQNHKNPTLLPTKDKS